MKTFESYTPNFVGRKVLDPINIQDIVPYINWKLFFKLWNYNEKFATVKNISMCGHCKAQWFAAFNEAEREGNESIQTLRRCICFIAKNNRY